MVDKLEIAINERIQERYNILAELYSLWFTESKCSIAPKNLFYQTEHIEHNRAIGYLLENNYIVADDINNDDENVKVSITIEGIDFYEEGYLSGKARGFQIVTEVKYEE
jgi:hypothetical protein